MSTSKPDNAAPHKRPIRVLTLNGRGVQCRSSLLLLRGLMERLGVRRGIAIPTSVRPSECFDLVVGTGTGGISALFLRRMRMTVDEAIEEYMRMAETAFAPTGIVGVFHRSHSLLNGGALELIIGNIANRFLGDRNTRLQDPSGDVTVCLTAVLASTSANADAPPYIFRSYITNQPASKFALHEVAHATVSTAGLFASVSLGNPAVQFIDASLVGYSNPTEVALQEAAQIWPGMTVDCLVSLGVGLQKIVTVGGKWAKLIEASERIVQYCERIHHRVFNERHRGALPYFRFNVTRGLDVVDVKEWRQAGSNGQLTIITEGYMKHPEVDVSLDSCTGILNDEMPYEILPPSDWHILNAQPLTTASSTAGIKARACQVMGQVFPGLPMNVMMDNKANFRKFLPILNPAPEIFCGRDEYIARAVAMLLDEKPARLAVLGLGGIGKTSIAQTILHVQRIQAKFGDHCHFISCEGITSNASLVDTQNGAFGLLNTSADWSRDLVLFLMHTYAKQPPPRSSLIILRRSGMLKGFIRG